MIKQTIQQLVTEAIKVSSPYVSIPDFDIDLAPAGMGDYAVNVAFALAKRLKKSPQDIAQELANELVKIKPDEVEKIEVVGAYINFFLALSYIQSELQTIASIKNYGNGTLWQGKKIMVEYTDPNVMKPFHIGHLMSNAIGESIARLYESQKAKVKRADYYSDIGMNVAKAVWGMKELQDDMPSEDADDITKTTFLGRAYTHGVENANKNLEIDQKIKDINKKLYEHSDSKWDELYYIGKRWSEEHFETLYKRFGTKFDYYYPESSVYKEGVAFVKKGLEAGVFKQSNGAIIFVGEEYDLHTRVFINAQGLPTYEAKELGLNKIKYDDYQFDQSIVVAASEIDEYFKVVLKAMELVNPEIAKKTTHISHGMMRLPEGKMASRTGNVVTGEELLDQTQKRIRQIIENDTNLTDQEKQDIELNVAVSAIKYSILKQSVGINIVYDIDKSISFQGDSGPYLQYTYARIKSILSKNHKTRITEHKSQDTSVQCLALNTLDNKHELGIIKYLLEFPETTTKATENHAPHYVATYVYELCNLVNTYYEQVRILTDENEDRKQARLFMLETTSKIIKQGLHILGIKTVEKI